MTIVFIRAVILYGIVIVAVRLMGKRQIGELQPSELVVTIMISNIATLPVEDTETPMLLGIVPILTVVCLDVIMSWISMKSRRMRKMLSGSPIVVINNGIIDRKCLNELRFSVDDLMESLRSSSIFDISEVQYAVVETTGKISVYQRSGYRQVTLSDLPQKPPADKNPPTLIIDDGKYVSKSLEAAGLTKGWLRAVLEKEKENSRNVYILTADSSGSYTLVNRSGKSSGGKLGRRGDK